MGLIKKLAQAEAGVDRLRDSLRRLPSPGSVPGVAGGGGAPGASAADVRGLGAQIGELGRKIDGMSARQGDPFLDDLMRGKGPRRA